MRIYIIRHGDPDYEHDTLTPRGEKEALALAPYLEQSPSSATVGSVPHGWGSCSIYHSL